MRGEHVRHPNFHVSDFTDDFKRAIFIIRIRRRDHQMMLLLHLEMQLRHQALVSYSQTTDPVVRLQRLDEVSSQCMPPE